MDYRPKIINLLIQHNKNNYDKSKIVNLNYLKSIYNVAYDYLHTLPIDVRVDVLSSIWLIDLAKKSSYNRSDIAHITNDFIADIYQAFLLYDDKKHNSLLPITITPYAGFVLLCKLIIDSKTKLFTTVKYFEIRDRLHIRAYDGMFKDLWQLALNERTY